MLKDDLFNDLTKAFIRYQWRLENPIPSTTETPAVMELRYLNDPIFHNKVLSIVTGVMEISDKYLANDSFDEEGELK